MAPLPAPLTAEAALAALLTLPEPLVSDASLAAVAAAQLRSIHSACGAALSWLTLAGDPTILEVVGSTGLEPTSLAAHTDSLAAGAALQPLLVLDGTEAAIRLGEAGRDLATELEKQGWDTVLVVPLFAAGRQVGVVVSTGSTSALLRDPARRKLIEVLAARAAGVIENQRRYRAALTESLTDARTGLPNGRYLQEHLPVVLAQAARSGRPLSLVFIDSDTLKVINDRYGHASGDAFIKELADTMKGRVRGRGQGVRSSDVVVRYTSGDECIIVMPDTDTQQAKIVAERLRLAVNRTPFVFGRERMECSISLGVATFPYDAETPEALIRRADEAMYLAKRLGKNRVVTAAQVADLTPSAAIERTAGAVPAGS